MQKLSGSSSRSQSGLLPRRCTRGHAAFCSIQQIASNCCSLFSHCYIAMHLISGLKLSRSSVYTGKNRSRSRSSNFTPCKQHISMDTSYVKRKKSIKGQGHCAFIKSFWFFDPCGHDIRLISCIDNTLVILNH